MKMASAPITIATSAYQTAVSIPGGSIRRYLLAMACIAGLPGCATLVTDDHQSIVVTSDPVGATCQVHQGATYVGTVNKTPGTIYVGKSRHDLAVDCVRPGYFPGAAVLQPNFQDWTFGNILYGGTLGLLVDTSSGAINEYPHWGSVMMKRQSPRGEAFSETEQVSDLEVTRHRRR
jgi:hypothetical protein